MRNWRHMITAAILQAAKSQIDRQPDTFINLFNSGIIVNLKKTEEKVLKKVLEIAENKRKKGK